MRVTEKKLAANRRNALKSTGRRSLFLVRPSASLGRLVILTSVKKRRCRLNALKHGAYANDLITFCADTKDNPKEYEQLLATLTEQIQPVGPVETSLVWKFTYYIWRYKKAMATLSTLYQIQRTRGHEPALIKLDDEI